MNVGDRVEVTFSDHHTEIGQIKSIDEHSDYKYCVTLKVYGKDTDVYCTEDQIRKVNWYEEQT